MFASTMYTMFVFFLYREKSGMVEYKVHWKDPKFYSAWVVRTRFDSPHLVDAFDAERLKNETERVRKIEHERLKIKNMRILRQR